MTNRILRLLPLLFACALAPLVFAQANLTLSDVSATPAPPGYNSFVDATYVLKGSSPATDVKITITIPPGTWYVGYRASGWFQCTEPPRYGQGDLLCTAQYLTTPQSDYVEAEVTIDPYVKPGTVITFPVTMTAPYAINKSQSLSGSLTVTATANLATTLSSPSTVVPGDSYANTVTVTNKGPGNAPNTTVDFTLMGLGSSMQSVSAPPGWSCITTSDGASCSIASFPPGTATFTFTASVLVNFKAGTLTQKATANTPIDSNHSDNTATSSTTIVMPPQTPVSLDLAASPDVVNTGDTLTYTAQMSNTGSADARNLDLTLQVPGSILTTTCGTPFALECSFPTLAAGATQTATVTVRTDAAPGTPLTASASLQGANLLNGYPESTVTTTVHATPHADLQAKMTAPPFLTPSEEGVWSCLVSNSGPDALNDWTLTFPLPSNVTFGGRMTVSGQATCNALPLHLPNVTVTCHGSTLPFQLDLGLVVDPSATGTVHATATVASSDDADPNTDNNTTSADTSTSPARRRAARH